MSYVYILIVIVAILDGSGGASTQLHEFDTKESCEAVRDVYLSQYKIGMNQEYVNKYVAINAKCIRITKLSDSTRSLKGSIPNLNGSGF